MLLLSRKAVNYVHMKGVLDFALGAYLDQTIGLNIELTPCADAKVPLFLRGRYDLAEGNLYNRAHVFFAPKSDFTDWTPSVIQSDQGQLASIFNRVPVFVAPRIQANQRQRLIQKHIPFIVPGTQLYLPDLLIDLREHFAGQRAKPVELLSPSAQGIFLMALEQRLGKFENAQTIARQVKYTAMTVGRSMDELESVRLARVMRTGKIKSLSFGTEGGGVNWRDLWERALPHLRSPVRRTFPLYDYPPTLLAQAHLGGLNALAHYSSLNESGKMVWVIGPEWYRSNAVALEQAEAPGPDWGEEILEIWTYDPGLAFNVPGSWIRDPLPKRGGIVDRLSLFLALRNNTDERVEQALSHMIEEIPW